jgi:peptide deformylase
MTIGQSIKINVGTGLIKSYDELKLVKFTDPILKRIPEKFDFSNPQIDPVYLASSMFHTMFKHKGFGLSANQVGYSLSVFTVGLDDSNKQIFFNPKIVEVAKEIEETIEGCLSYPNLFLKIKRPKWVVIDWQHIDGKSNERRYEGLTARIILHEMDHQNGSNFTNLVGKTTLMMAREKVKKINKNKVISA